MPSRALVDMRAEIEGALAVVDPKIRGLASIALGSITPETGEFVSLEAVMHHRRRDLLHAVLTALNALDADGYPVVVQSVVPKSVFDDLSIEVSDEKAAIGGFIAEQEAVEIIVGDLGDPSPIV